MSNILHSNSVLNSDKIVYDLIDDPSRLDDDSYIQEDWIRPSDWINIPTPIVGEEVINILFAVFQEGPNFLSLKVSGTFSIDWGDGTTQSVSSGSLARKEFNWNGLSASTTTSENFRQAFVKITPLFPGTLTSIDFQNYHSYNSRYTEVNIMEIKMSAPKLTSLIINNDVSNFNQFVKLRSFEFIGTHSVVDMNRLFNGCIDLKRVKIDLGGVTNATYMFGSCTNLTDLDIVNTKSVINMSYMFQYCYSLRCAHYTRDLIIDASSCTDMSYMFQNCHALIETPTILNSSNVVNMSYMFSECNNLRRVISFSASSVTDMSYMFKNCHVLINLPLIDTPNLQDMSYMFQNCYQLSSIPKFDTKNVTTMYYTFQSCSNLVSDIGDNFQKGFPLLNTSKVTDMRGTFYGCGRIKVLPLLDTGNVTRMEMMFYACSIESVPLFNTSKVWDMKEMFKYCGRLIDVPLLDTSSVTDMSGMFYHCVALKTVPLFNTQNVTKMYQMFRCDHSGSLLSIPKFNTQNVTDMSEMFFKQGFLISYPELDTSKITTSNYMFYSCWSLKEVGNFGSTYSGNMYQMFYGCGNLRKIGYLNFPNAWDLRGTFQWCGRLESIAGITASPYYLHYTFEGCGQLKTIPYFNTSGVIGDQSMYATFRYCSSIETIPNFDFRNVKTFEYTFEHCSSLKYIPYINTKSSTNFQSMFNNCYHLESVPVFDVSATGRASTSITLNNMFQNCYNLKVVTFSNATASGYSAQATFDGCINLEKVALPDFIVHSPGQMFKNCHNLLEIGTFSFYATGWDNWGGYSATFQNCYKLDNIKDVIFLGRSRDFNAMFQNCISLTETPYFDMSEGGWVGQWQIRQDFMFSGCENLMKINATGSRMKVNLNRTNLDYKNISNFLKNIISYNNVDWSYSGTDIGSNNTIGLYDNPGLPEMISIHKRKIVFEKGYTFSYSWSDNGNYTSYPWQNLALYIQINDNKSYYGSGNTVSNISGYKYPDTTFLNGTLINSPIYNLDIVNYDDYVANSFDDLLPPGKSSNFEFNGVNQCITFGTPSTILSSGTIFTVFELTELPQAGKTHSIMGRYGSTSSNYFLDFTDGRLRFGFTQMGSNIIRHRTLNATFSVGVRYSIFARYYNWGSHICDIWVNDVLQTTSNNYSENISSFPGELRMAEDVKNVLSIAGDYYNNRNYSKIKVYAAGLYYKLIETWEVNELNYLFKRLYLL